MLDIVSALRRILIDGVRITHEDAFPTSTLTRWQARDLQVFEYRALLDETVYGLLHLTNGQGHVLFLDEPDNYVALAEIQPWLMELSDLSLPQVVLCSHHPELIDYLGGECGLVLAREESGAVTVRHPDLAVLKAGAKLSEWVARGWAH